MVQRYNLRGAIIAGGSGRRMLQISKGGNKHLSEIYDTLMIDLSLGTLEKIGVPHITLVTSPQYLLSFQEYLANYKNIGYKTQEKPGGIAQALGICDPRTKDQIAEKSIPKEIAQRKILAILGDNYFVKPVHLPDAAFYDNNAYIVITEVDKPWDYGCCKFDKENSLIDIIEKPPQGTEPSNKIVTGLYLYPEAELFSQIIPSLKTSKRGELEITEVNNAFLKQSRLRYIEYSKGFWVDAGTSLPNRLEAILIQAILSEGFEKVNEIYKRIMENMRKIND